MKITDVRVFPVANFVYVKIETGEDIHGIGEASLSGRPTRPRVQSALAGTDSDVALWNLNGKAWEFPAIASWAGPPETWFSSTDTWAAVPPKSMLPAKPAYRPGNASGSERDAVDPLI